jgi:hypothetical protein
MDIEIEGLGYCTERAIALEFVRRSPQNLDPASLGVGERLAEKARLAESRRGCPLDYLAFTVDGPVKGGAQRGELAAPSDEVREVGRARSSARIRFRADLLQLALH